MVSSVHGVDNLECCPDGWVGDLCDGRDRRGWSMRHGHGKHLKRQSGPDRPRGRACFARTVNTRCRRQCPDSWACDVSKRRRETNADMYWQLREELQTVDMHMGDDTHWDERVRLESHHGSDWQQQGEELSGHCLTGQCCGCRTETSPLAIAICPFSAELGQCSSPWDLAVARAAEVAAQFAMLKQSLVEGNESSDRCKSKRSERETKAITTLHQVREEFLKVHGQYVREALSGVLGDATQLIDSQLAPEIEKRFLDACGVMTDRLPENLVPVFHGTASNTYASIFAKGLLVPDASNGVRVVHGSAYGVGIYATIGGSVSMSRSYCNDNSLLVCGLLDATDASVVSCHSWGRVVFDSRRIVPLFQAIGAGAIVNQQVGLMSAPKASRNLTRVSNGALRVLQNLADATAQRKSLTSRVVQTVPTCRRDAVMRRAARKRSQRKTNSVQIIRW